MTTYYQTLTLQTHSFHATSTTSSATTLASYTPPSPALGSNYIVNAHADTDTETLQTTPPHPASRPTPTQTITFLHLPYELRAQIYVAALNPIKPTALPPTPGLLRTSRILYAETCPILYATSVFLLHDSLLTALPRPYAAPAHLLAHLSQLAKSSIRKWRLRIRLDCGLRFSPAMAAEQLSGVAELGVEAWTAAFGVVGCWNLVHGLGEVRGVKVCRVEGSVRNGDEEDAAEWVEHVVRLKVGEAPGARWEGEGKVGGIEVGNGRTWVDRG